MSATMDAIYGLAVSIGVVGLVTDSVVKLAPPPVTADFFEVSEKVRRLREMRNEKDKKRAAAKKRAEKKALNKKVATNFMKGMVTKRIVTPTRATIKAVMPMPKPQKKAMPLTKDVARKRIMAMKGLNGRNKFSLVNRLSLNQHSPRRVVRLARELARLR